MPKYTIRVYGLWVNEQSQILLSDERIGEHSFTKFPGGGMEKGEGTIECLQREWLEEQHLEIEVISHFYTTDSYQASAFHKDTQLMSIYYWVQPTNKTVRPYSTLVETFDYNQNREELFRWVPLAELTEEMVTFPIDKHVVKLITEKWSRTARPF